MFKTIKYIFLNLYTVFKHLFKKSVTLEYPEKKQEMGKYFRGKLFIKNCHGCTTCIKVCPTKAISFNKDSMHKITSVSFDLSKCIFCGNCAYYCPFGAIQMLKNYELGTANKQDLKLIYEIEG